jgi:GTP-binding protein
MIKPNLNNVTLKISAGVPKQFPREALPQIAVSGRSNVGKSSLINTLLGRKSLARVSASPGKTITVNFYDIDKKLYFVDLPGYGYAKRSQESRKQPQ